MTKPSERICKKCEHARNIYAKEGEKMEIFDNTIYCRYTDLIKTIDVCWECSKLRK